MLCSGQSGPGIQAIILKPGNKMNVKVRHRLLSRNTTGVKQVYACCANSRLVMQGNLLSNGEK